MNRGFIVASMCCAAGGMLATYIGVAIDSVYAEEVKELQACTALRPFPAIEAATNYGAKGLWGKSNKCARDNVDPWTECYCTAEPDNTCMMFGTVPDKDCGNVLDTFTAYLQYGVAVQATSGTACFFLLLIELVVLCFLNKHPTPEQIALLEKEGNEYASGFFEELTEDFGVAGGDSGVKPINEGEGGCMRQFLYVYVSVSVYVLYAMHHVCT